MHLHIQALKQALLGLGIAPSMVPGFPDALMVRGRPFIRTTTPFNDEGVSALCRDKAAVHALLDGKVRMPKTRAFLDPAGRYPELCQARSIDEIVESSLDFLYPRIVKMNRGRAGRHVFLAKDEAGFRDSLGKVFDKASRHYDYIALVQEHVEPRAEYRVAVSGGRPTLAYGRDSFGFVDAPIASDLFETCGQILAEIPVSWGSLDFIESTDGSLYFLEANTQPSHEGFIQKNGGGAIRDLYALALRQFLDGEKSEGDPQISAFGALVRRFNPASRLRAKEKRDP